MRATRESLAVYRQLSYEELENRVKRVSSRGISKRFVFLGIASVVFVMSILFLYLKESSDEMNDLLENRGSSNTLKKFVYTTASL